MTVDYNPARTRLRNPNLPRLVAAAQGRHHTGPAQAAPGPEKHIARTGPHDHTIADLHGEGHSDAAIARRIGIPRQDVWAARQRLHLDSNGRWGHR